MTIRKLRNLGKKWQYTLGLYEWTIHIDWGKDDEMGDNDGLSSWQPEYEEAWVRLRKKCVIPESILVHELLHITLEGHAEVKSKYDAMYERGLNRIANGLLLNNLT